MPPRTIDVRRAGTRFHTVTDGTDTWHSFSFGVHYDPDNVAFGPLLVHNDERVRPGSGFPEHRHTDAEIVTWVLEGSLTHEDSTGHRVEVVPGVVQRLSAGAGVTHAERNTGSDPLRFVQTWLRPDTPGAPPAYAVRPVDLAGLEGEWRPVASGAHPDAAVTIGTRAATLWVTRLGPGHHRRLPDGTHVHAFVATGAVAAEAVGVLGEGDALRLSGADPLRLTGVRPAELLVWTRMDP